MVVAESHPLVVKGIASLFAPEEDVDLLAHSADGDEAIDIIRGLKPDVAVLSLHLPRKGALEVLEALAHEKLKTRAVILAVRMNEDEFLRAMHLGVRGVVLKEMPAPLLLRCVRVVHAGMEFIEKELFLRAFGRLIRHSSARGPVAKLLSPREGTVVEHAVSGLSNKEIARRMSISEGTVKVLLHRAYGKLSVHGRMGLLGYARDQGLI